MLPPAPQFVRHPDPAAWAALHAAAPEATVYSAGWWLDEVTGRSWGAVVVPDGTGGYAAALPVPLRRRWRGVGPTEIFQPFVTQQLGVLARASYGAVPLDAAPFLAALPPVSRTYGQLHVANTLRPPAPAGFRVGERVTYLLSLAPAYPALAAAFHHNHRRNLRKAATLMVRSEEPAPLIQPLIALFRDTKGRETPDVKPRHYTLLARLLAGLAGRGQLRACTAREPGTGALLAGGLFAADERQFIYLLGATAPAGRGRGAAHAVLDQLIRQEAGTPRTLDFEGSMIPSIARFYAGFGAHPVPYLTFERP